MHMMPVARIPCRGATTLPASCPTFFRVPRASLLLPARPSSPACSSHEDDRTADASTSAPEARRGPRFRRHTAGRQREEQELADDLESMERTPSNDLQEMARLFNLLQPTDTAHSQLESIQDRANLSMRAERLQDMDNAELRAHSKSISKYNSLAHIEQTLLEPLALDAIREQLSAEDAALLGKLFVKDEGSADIGTGLRQSSVGRQLLKLKLPERRRLKGLMSRMQALAEEFEVMGEVKNYMDEKLTIRRRRRAAQKGLAVTDQAGQGDEDAWESGTGAEYPTEQAEDPDAFQTPASADRMNSSSGSSSSSKRAWGSSFATSKSRGSQRSGGSGSKRKAPAADPSDPAAQIAQLMSDVTQRYIQGDGWQEELEGSKDLQRLKRLVAKLTTLADPNVLVLDGTDLTPLQFMQDVKDAVQEVELMAATGPRSLDPVVRDSVEFMTQHLVTRSGAGVDELQFEPETIARLAEFVKAAEVWQLYQPFLQTAVEQQDFMGVEGLDDSMPAMLAALNQRTKWWLKDDTQQGSGSSPRQDASSGQATSPSAVEVDVEKIASLASVDPLVLSMLTDLLGSGFSEEVLIKYSMHPTLGPKLRSGDWLASMPMDGMPELVKQSWEEALRS